MVWKCDGDNDDGFTIAAYTRCLPFTLVGGITAIKTIGALARQMFRRDWRTGVFNNTMYLVVSAFYLKSNGFTWRRIAHRIRRVTTGWLCAAWDGT
ncbi:hypothetical protein KCP77_19395 [Salmonella enterica subsp. enterica]|nr:hypothetical protein KCP77_19395 [Salmonella enterica subsp. enterica]